LETCKSGSEGGNWKRTETYLASCLPYIDIVPVYRGSVNSSQVRVGELFKAAIRRSATAIIVVHNHPSDDPTPSPDDVAVTRAIVQAGKLLDLEVLDHLIISRGHGRWTSMKERGLGFP
jgi:DNA repair protein RadC